MTFDLIKKNFMSILKSNPFSKLKSLYHLTNEALLGLVKILFFQKEVHFPESLALENSKEM